MKALTHRPRFVGVVAILTILTSTVESRANADLPPFDDLQTRIGSSEEVRLRVYFVGFPDGLEGDLEETIRERAEALQIVDSKPWWIPNMPRYGAKDFAVRPAPSNLPEHLVPPDGLIRYEPNSIRKVRKFLGPDTWRVDHDLVDLYADWHENVDVVYYTEHEGSYRDVPWEVSELEVEFLSANVLDELYDRLIDSESVLTSENPKATFRTYSYSELFDWLSENELIEEPEGGAAVVFINFEAFAGDDYTFEANPLGDLEDVTGVVYSEVQYPPTSPDGIDNQWAASTLTSILDGGLTQAKMRAALEVVCDRTTTAARAGKWSLGMKFRQPVCERWSLRPIRNLLGNHGRMYFVSDGTDLIAGHSRGELSRAELLEGVSDNFFELYRYGVLQTSIKGSAYSEAYELRTIVLDLRFGAQESCMSDYLDMGLPDLLVYLICPATGTGITEKTYSVEDVFDTELARRSLEEFAPADWDLTMRDFPLDLGIAGTVDVLSGVVLKKFLRTYLSRPLYPNIDLVEGAGIGALAEHSPLYRNLSVVEADGSTTEITSSWERGFDFTNTTGLLGLLPDVYQAFFPEDQPVDARPYHETGERVVIPHMLILSPPPDGPSGEKWGPFPIDTQAAGEVGLLTAYSGGGWWVSVGGNELGGTLRRDFLSIVPQYGLGPRRGAGQDSSYWVMPDGSVERSRTLSAFLGRSLDMGSPHWCNEFNSSDPDKRAACRAFVLRNTTIQSIETIQHGLGYMHAPEPRVRYHYDGSLGSIKRLLELNEGSDDVGRLLHRTVNQYTTLGVSTVWGQVTSEWNGIAPQSGMQATLFRSHAREEIDAAEELLSEAIDRSGALGEPAQVVALLEDAVALHSLAIDQYLAWEYRKSLDSAVSLVSLLAEVFDELGEPDRLYDPLGTLPLEAGPTPSELPFPSARSLLDTLRTILN